MSKRPRSQTTKTARDKARQRDRKLCPVPISGILQLKVADVAAAMRAAGETTPLSVPQAKRILAGTDPIPDWLASLYAEQAAAKATRLALRQEKAMAKAVSRLAAEQRAAEKLKAGARRFSDEELHFVHDWAFRAAKDLVRDGPAGQCSPFDRAALEACGIDPDDHRTWLVHAGGCDGNGTAHCFDRG